MVISLGVIGDFFSIFVYPSKVLEKIDRETRGISSTITKLFIGFALSMVASALAFFGIIILEIYFLINGKINFSFALIINPIYAAIIIPMIFWILDTIFLLIGVIIVSIKPNIIGLINLRAFSLAPIPIKLLYIYYSYGDLALNHIIGIPKTIISALLSLWSILLLAKGIKKFFDTNFLKAIIAASIPFLLKILIAIMLYGL